MSHALSTLCSIDTFLEKISQNILRVGEPCKTVSVMVWADFPSGLAVSQVGNLECPPWNVFDGDVLHAVTQFAANYADEGWYITCSLMDHFPRIHTVARQTGFTMHRTITLHVDSGYIYEDGEEVSYNLIKFSCDILESDDFTDFEILLGSDSCSWHLSSKKL